MPSFKHTAHTGETARPWGDIVTFYANLADDNEAFQPLRGISAWLAASPYVREGLCGLTSMHDLLLGPSARVLGNPYLLVRWDFDARLFQLTYEDGTEPPWQRSATADEAPGVLERFFTKRARWYGGAEVSSP